MQRVRCAECGAVNETYDPEGGRCRLCGTALARGEHLGVASTTRRQLRTLLTIATALAVAGAFVIAMVLSVVLCETDEECSSGDQSGSSASTPLPGRPTPGVGPTGIDDPVTTSTSGPTVIEADTMRTAAGWASVVAAVSLTALGLRFLARRHLYMDVPTSATTAVYVGLNQVDGVARCVAPLRTCRDHEAAVIRRLTTTVTRETNHQGEQKVTRRTSHERQGVVFMVEDAHGAIEVDPAGAVLHTHVTDERSFPQGNGEIVRQDNFVPLGVPITVIGPVGVPDDGLVPRISLDPEMGPFLITVGGESEQLSSDLGWLVISQTAAVILSVVGTVLLPSFGGALFPVALTGPALILLTDLVAYLVLVYNSLARLREGLRRALSLIDVQLRRRADLLPRLVEIVAGYASHEQRTQVTLAGTRSHHPGRADSLSAEHLAATGEAMQAQESAGRALLAVSEGYPDLQADEQFRALQRELTATEDRVALARRFYHDARLQYDQRATTFPGLLVAWATGRTPAEPWARPRR